MEKRVRAVLDTNVLISAFLTAGSSREVRDLARKGKFKSFTSHFILEECWRILTAKLKFPEEVAEDALRRIENLSKVVTISKKLKTIVADPKDNPIIETAFQAKADYLVTNDNKLLDVGEYQGIKIKTSAEFLSLIKK